MGLTTPPPMNAPFPIRTECPPGACTCRREELLADPNADIRVLRLTREEENDSWHGWKA